MNPAELVAALRAAGVTVVEHDGWTTRARPGVWSPLGTIWHHTAGPGPEHGPAPSLAHCITNVLCHVVVGRDGVWHLIGWGLTWHAGLGVPDVLDRSRRGVAPAGDAAHVYPSGSSSIGGNAYYLGVECENTGVGEPWPAVMLDSMRAGTAAIHRAAGWPADTLIAHREWTERKVDPAGLNMPAERALIARLIAEPEGPDDVTPAELEKIVTKVVRKVVADELADSERRQRDWFVLRGTRGVFRDLLVNTAARGAARAIKAEFRSAEGVRAAADVDK